MTIDFKHVFRTLGAIVLTLGLLGGAQGQDGDKSGWQDVITGQLEAFRSGDHDAAFALAGETFHNAYGTADQFAQRIRSFGYGPLLNSRTHSFGGYTMEDGRVLQVVSFEGPNQNRYEALYILEPEGNEWRVQAVMMRGTEEMGV